jgi:hypothetical protein
MITVLLPPELAAVRVIVSSAVPVPVRVKVVSGVGT